jgi:hypothetical protein
MIGQQMLKGLGIKDSQAACAVSVAVDLVPVIILDLPGTIFVK